jgi:hypothetical protein
VNGQYKNEVIHEAWAYKKKKLDQEATNAAKLQARWDRFRDNYNRVRGAYGELEGLEIAVNLTKYGRWEGRLRVLASCQEIQIEPLPFAYPFLLGLEMVLPVPTEDRKKTLELPVPLVMFSARWDFHERYQENSKKVQYADDHAYWQNLLGGEDLCSDAVLNHALGRIKRDIEVLNLPDVYPPVPDDARGLDL